MDSFLKSINSIRQFRFSENLQPCYIESGQTLFNSLKNYFSSKINENIPNWDPTKSICPVEYFLQETQLPEDLVYSSVSVISKTPIFFVDRVYVHELQKIYVLNNIPGIFINSINSIYSTFFTSVPNIDRNLLSFLSGFLKVDVFFCPFSKIQSVIQYYHNLEKISYVNSLLVHAGLYDVLREMGLDLSFITDLKSYYDLQKINSFTEAKKIILNKILEKDYLTENYLLLKKNLISGFPILFLKQFVDDYLRSAFQEHLDVKIQKKYRIIPVLGVGYSLSIITDQILKRDVMDEISNYFKQRVRPFYILTTTSIFDSFLQCAFIEGLQIDESAKALVNSESYDVKGEILDLDKLVSDNSNDDEVVKRIVGTILTRAIASRATDIHISAQPEETRVRVRVDGQLIDMGLNLPPAAYKKIISRIKIMSGIDIKHNPKPQDGKFSFSVEQTNYDIRVNTCSTIWGEKAVLRIQKNISIRPRLSDLGLREREIERIKKAIDSDHGMIVICGPTGSGKTTTLHSILALIDIHKYNVITAENPVEIKVPYLEQTEINGVDMTFADFIRAALRQDPDYILIGETRDSETAAEAIRSSITGHIVLTTIHANSVSGVPQRLIDLGCEPYLVADALQMILGQRLIRKICRQCRQPVYDLSRLESYCNHFNIPIPGNTVIYQAQGCTECNYTGYTGRIAIAESLIVDDNVRDVILNKNASVKDLDLILHSQGGKTLFEEALLAVIEGKTSLDEALQVRTFSESI